MADSNGMDTNDISPEMTPALAKTIIGIGGGSVGSSMALGPYGLLAGEDLGTPPATETAAPEAGAAWLADAATTGDLSTDRPSEPVPVQAADPRTLH